jgi:hypothetical protein
MGISGGDRGGNDQQLPSILAARLIRDDGVGGSNPLTPTNRLNWKTCHTFGIGASRLARLVGSCQIMPEIERFR